MRAAIATSLCAVALAYADQGTQPGPADSAGLCHRYASPSGSNRARGSQAHPYRTVARLGRSLSPGQTGCLRAGVYARDVRLVARGRRGAPVTLRSFPGERARVRGRLWVSKLARHLVIERLDLDGRNRSRLPSPTVNGRDVTFRHNDVTNRHSAICFVLGSHGRFGRARRTALQGNRIHDCGRLPANGHEHGIYVEAADDTLIAGNWIYDNADYGVHLYPDARRTRLTGNVIDGNGRGVIFAGEGPFASSGNLVAGNYITGSRRGFNAESWFPRQPGSGNLLSGNCLGGGPRDRGDGGVRRPLRGFAAEGNRVAIPSYLDRARKDFRIRDAGACMGVPGTGELIPGP